MNKDFNKALEFNDCFKFAAYVTVYMNDTLSLKYLKNCLRIISSNLFV